MAYTPQTWVNSPSTSSPLSADRLNNMEVGIGYASNVLDVYRAEELTVGEAIFPRVDASSSVSMTSGMLRLTYFTAAKTETITKVRTSVITTNQIGATTARIGIYSINSSTGDLTLVANTTNDTTLWNSATVYTKSLAGNFNKVSGTRYAVGFLVIGGSQVATLLGATSGNAAEFAFSPRICGQVASQTSLPTSVTYSTIANSNSRPYAALLPA